MTTTSPTRPARRRIVGPGRHDLDDQVVVDQHARHQRAVLVVGLPGDHAEIGGGVGLPRLDPRRLEFGAQALRQRRARDQGLADRGDVGVRGARLVEHDLQEIRRAAINARPQMRDRRDELLAVSRPSRNDGAAERDRAALENPPAGRQMIGKAVDHDLACLAPPRRTGLSPRPKGRRLRTRARKGRPGRRTGAGKR